MGIQPDSCSDGLSAVNLMKPEIELATSKSNFDVLMSFGMALSASISSSMITILSFTSLLPGGKLSHAILLSSM